MSPHSPLPIPNGSLVERREGGGEGGGKEKKKKCPSTLPTFSSLCLSWYHHWGGQKKKGGGERKSPALTHLIVHYNGGDSWYRSTEGKGKEEGGKKFFFWIQGVHRSSNGFEKAIDARRGVIKRSEWMEGRWKRKREKGGGEFMLQDSTLVLFVLI